MASLKTGKITSLFLTEIYIQKAFLSPRDTKSLQEECYQIRDSDAIGQRWSQKNYLGGYTSYASIPKVPLLSSSFLDLEKKIHTHVARFSDLLDYDLKPRQVYCNSLWINIMPPGVVHTGHIHPQSFISGTIYLSVPPKASSLKFEDPRLGFLMAAPLQKKKLKVEHQRFFQFAPQAGDLVLFESWLRHEVPANPAKKDRISVSFNYDWKSL
ncbi:MAG: TIGR02466 family protein [Proteobacteria bacterium]|jgi:uncharacterized protein (TIGR02466 family)|nr:TIGR02466 family protein [Pseudomonadota bacterium]